VIGIIGEGILTGNNRHTNFDGGVDAFHTVDVIPGVQGVSVGIVGQRVGVRLPTAVVLVADFPILESVMIRDIRVRYPGCCLLRRTGTVIRSPVLGCQ
jgi:hypothetical protein